MNLQTLDVAVKTALEAHDRAYFQLRGLMNDQAGADMRTVRLNLIDAQNWIAANRGDVGPR